MINAQCPGICSQTLLWLGTSSILHEHYGQSQNPPPLCFSMGLELSCLPGWEQYLSLEISAHISLKTIQQSYFNHTYKSMSFWGFLHLHLQLFFFILMIQKYKKMWIDLWDKGPLNIIRFGWSSWEKEGIICTFLCILGRREFFIHFHISTQQQKNGIMVH